MTHTLKRKHVYVTDKTANALGKRSTSLVLNQTVLRIETAGRDIKITDKDREFYKANKKKPKAHNYPDQAELLERFAKETGRTLSEAVVVLDKVEREHCNE